MTSNTVHVQKERHSSSWLGNSVRWFVVHEPVNIHTLQSYITISLLRDYGHTMVCERWLIHKRHFSMLTAQAREAAILTLTQRQATTASRKAWVIRYLKKGPTRLYKDATSSLPDATSSLKRRTCECSFREKAILVGWNALGRWSPATQTEGSAAWCVQSTRHRKNHHRCSAVPPAWDSSEERAQLVEFTRQQKSEAEWCNRSTPKRKAEYAMHLLPTYTHAGISGS